MARVTHESRDNTTFPTLNERRPRKKTSDLAASISTGKTFGDARGIQIVTAVPSAAFSRRTFRKRVIRVRVLFIRPKIKLYFAFIHTNRDRPVSTALNTVVERIRLSKTMPFNRNCLVDELLK